MRNRHWQRGDGAPVVAWLIYDTTFTHVGKRDIFVSACEERLPYTAAMLARRQASGRDIPDWLKENESEQT